MIGNNRARRAVKAVAGCVALWVHAVRVIALMAAANSFAEEGTGEHLPAQAVVRGPLAAKLQRKIESAELVARVEITGIQRMVDHALSEPGMVAVMGYQYSGAAHKVWKGAANENIAFRLNLADCQHKLHVGQQYLIFAHANPLGYLELMSCEAAVANSEVGPWLVQLDQYYQG